MKLLWPFLHLFRRQWLMMSLGLLLTLFTLLAGIGLLSLSGWFLSAAAVAGLAGAAMNYFTPAGGVRFFSIVRTASRYGERLLTHEATFRILTDLRCWTWKSLLPLSEGNLSGIRRADLLNRLVADIDTLDHLYLRLLTPLAAYLLLLVSLFVFVSYFDLALACWLCGGLLLAALLLPTLFYYLGKQPGRAVIEARRHYRVQLLEWLAGQAELTLFAAAERYRHRLQDTAQHWLASQQRMASITGFSQGLLILCHGLLVLSVLWFAAAGVGDSVPPGPLLALMVFCALACFEMMMPLAGAFQHLSATLLAAERVMDLTTRQPDIVFPANTTAAPCDGGFSFNEVQFAYLPGQVVLQQLSLTVPSGSKVALLGKTGCGKSSLLGLLTRQWQPQQGTIMLAGQAIEQYAEQQLRQAMTVMSQRVQLLSASLRDNLQLAVAEQVSDERLQQVLQQVGLQSLLSGDGLNSWIGEGGRQLSGGEQRRIGVARVLLRDTPLLLLDEATEGLDRRTEQEILKLLLQHAQGKTLLMISHRLTGMAQMDRIHLMENGQIRASGNHQELLEQDAVYAGLYHQLRR